MMAQIAKQLGVSPQAAASNLSNILPGVIDKLTPKGQIPDQASVMASGLSVIQSLLK